MIIKNLNDERWRFYYNGREFTIILYDGRKPVVIDDIEMAGFLGVREAETKKTLKSYHFRYTNQLWNTLSYTLKENLS